jgi:hypothetical protein
MNDRAARIFRGRVGRVGAVLAAGAFSAGAAFALKPPAAEAAWEESSAARRSERRPVEDPPAEPRPWVEPGDDDGRSRSDVFTPPALRWDAARAAWTDEPVEVAAVAGADAADGGGGRPAEPRLEVIAAGGRFRAIQLVGYVRGTAGLEGVFEVGARRELTLAGAGTAWPALGLRVESVDLTAPGDEIRGGGRARAVVRDLATGETIELVEGVPGLRGEARAWVRVEGEDRDEVLDVGGRLRAGSRSVLLERVDLATRRVHLVVEDEAGGQERRIERVPLRREEDGP